MQLLAERGREYEVTEGLGWIAGEVDRITPADPQLKIPHMGWNTLNVTRPHKLVGGCNWVRRDCMPISYTHTNSRSAQRTRSRGGGRLWRPAHRNRGARQYRRHAIPSREKPKARPGGDRQFSQVEAVILFPAIDLKNGEAVRLEQGDMARATVFHRDPAEQARAFAAQGFAYLHIVDLDGAFAGRPMHAAAVERSWPRCVFRCRLAAASAITRPSKAGSARASTRVIIGTAAVRNPALVKEAAKEFPGRVAVGLDARDGKVAVEGWAQSSELSAKEVARRFEDAGVAAIVYTDIARDGMLKGLDLDATIALADEVSIPVIASGGFASLDDVRALLAPRAKKLAGAIVGARAL